MFDTILDKLASALDNKTLSQETKLWLAHIKGMIEAQANPSVINEKFNELIEVAQRLNDQDFKLAKRIDDLERAVYEMQQEKHKPSMNPINTDPIKLSSGQ